MIRWKVLAILFTELLKFLYDKKTFSELINCLGKKIISENNFEYQKDSIPIFYRIKNRVQISFVSSQDAHTNSKGYFVQNNFLNDGFKDLWYTKYIALKAKDFP